MRRVHSVERAAEDVELCLRRASAARVHRGDLVAAADKDVCHERGKAGEVEADEAPTEVCEERHQRHGCAREGAEQAEHRPQRLLVADNNAEHSVAKGACEAAEEKRLLCLAEGLRAAYLLYLSCVKCA